MLFLELTLDVVVSVTVERSHPMKKARTLTVLHHQLRVAGAIHLADCVPVGTSAIRHESLEVHQIDPMSSHDFIGALPHDALSLTILRLHITNSNCHNTTITGVIAMACHGGPMLDALDMVKHEPSIF